MSPTAFLCGEMGHLGSQRPRDSEDSEQREENVVWGLSSGGNDLGGRAGVRDPERGLLDCKEMEPVNHKINPECVLEG